MLFNYHVTTSSGQRRQGNQGTRQAHLEHLICKGTTILVNNSVQQLPLVNV